MAVDVTGFQRMRREQAKKAVLIIEKKGTPVWEEMDYNDLKAVAKEAGIEGYHKMKKEDLIKALKALKG